MVAREKPTGKATADDFSQRGQVGIDIPNPLRAAIAQPKRDDPIEDQQRADL
jgi:hypothetical protein